MTETAKPTNETRPVHQLNGGPASIQRKWIDSKGRVHWRDEPESEAA